MCSSATTAAAARFTSTAAGPPAAPSPPDNRGGTMKAVLRTTMAGALALGLAACGSDNTNDATGPYAEGKTFTMILSADPGSLDPHFAALSVTLQADRFL